MECREEVLETLELLQQELKEKTGPSNIGAPEKITIRPDDHNAKYVGLTEGGLQFFVADLFVPAFEGPGTGNEFFAIFLFDKSGDLVEAKVDEFGPRDTMDLAAVRALCAQRLSELGPFSLGEINVKPFAVERFGEMMGLIPSKFEDDWCVELLPGNVMGFSEPWDSGYYST